MTRATATALLLTTTVLTAGCGAARVALDEMTGDGVPRPAETVELFSGDTGEHRWALVAGESGDGPVLQTYRDGELQGTSWGWLDSRSFESPIDVSSGVPHADGDDIDSPLLDHLQGYVRTHASIEEIVLYRGEDVVGRWEPVPHPMADFAVAPVAASGTLTDTRFWVVACRAGEPVATNLAWSPADGSFSTPVLDPCGDR